MIPAELRRQLEAVKEGQIVGAHQVRPILVDANRVLCELFDALFDDQELFNEAKEAFVWGWEPEFMRAKDDD